MSNEIAFKPDAAMEAATRAEFTYRITPKTITITDTTLGKLSVTKDMMPSYAKLSTGTKARSPRSKSCTPMNTRLGTVFGGTPGSILCNTS